MVMEVSEEIASEYLQELEWSVMKMTHMEAQAKLDREQAEMEYQVQMALLNDQVKAAGAGAVTERLAMEQRIRELEAQLNGS